MTKYLLIAGHGPRRNGTYDSGAIGHIRKGEHRYMKEDLFPAMKKYAGKDFIFYDSRNVFSYGNIVSLARSYGKDVQVIEFHYDASGSPSASGGHVIVYSHYRPDALDLRLRDAIGDMVGVRYSHMGHRGISGRSNLANVNRAASGGVNYRLLELGFGTNRRDADIMVKDVDKYAKRLVEAITNKGAKPVKPSVSTPIAPSVPSPAKSISQMADEVEAGFHDNGHTNRQKSLGVNNATYAKVRAEVNKRAGASEPRPAKKSNAVIAQEVINGEWGNSPDRERRLGSAGYNAATIQAEVNRILAPKPKKKSTRTIAQEVIDGKWSTGDDRVRRLNNAGYNASAVQAEVNKILGATSPKKKSNSAIAREVIDGKWGTGDKRASALTRAGYNASAVQAEVNRILGASTSSRKTTKQLADEVMRGIHGDGDRRKKSLGSRYQEVQNYINRNY